MGAIRGNIPFTDGRLGHSEVHPPPTLTNIQALCHSAFACYQQGLEMGPPAWCQKSGSERQRKVHPLQLFLNILFWGQGGQDLQYRIQGLDLHRRIPWR